LDRLKDFLVDLLLLEIFPNRYDRFFQLIDFFLLLSIQIAEEMTEAAKNLITKHYSN
jgi:hypothetical protein